MTVRVRRARVKPCVRSRPRPITREPADVRGRLAWAHDWVTDPSLAAVFETLPGTNFIVNGALPVKDSALASAGAELASPTA